MSKPSKTITAAMQEAPGLRALTQRIALSQRRLEAIAAVLPGSLSSQISSGNCDDTDWCILASNNGVAAKLRQLLPRLQQRLLTQENREVNIRIRVIHLN
jgi:uncharacterized protein YgfB (UPF0149 family)